MTGSNSANMSLEDKIVQTLKDDHLMKLVGDEDAIRTLVDKAIRQALFEPSYTTDNYGRRTITRDSVSIQEARKVAEKTAREFAEKITQDLMKNQDFMNSVRQMILASIPAYIAEQTSSMVQQSCYNVVQEQIQHLKSMGEL